MYSRTYTYVVVQCSINMQRKKPLKIAKDEMHTHTNANTSFSLSPAPSALNILAVAAGCQWVVEGVAWGVRMPAGWQQGAWWGIGRYSCPHGLHADEWQWKRSTLETRVRGQVVTMLFEKPGGIHNLITVRGREKNTFADGCRVLALKYSQCQCLLFYRCCWVR